MIKLNKKASSQAPEILATKGAETTQQLMADYEQGMSMFSFDNTIYGNATVKEVLRILQNDKCCFCEAKISHIAFGDVEHFRPKGGWVQEDEPINTPGYYWLAYDWDNLLLSCQICNQRHKKNYFPLLNPECRANYPEDIQNEAPVFIHPVNDFPENHIEFKMEIPLTINNSIRGRKTIEKLGLDREMLNEHRRSLLYPLKMIIDLANGHPETPLKEEAKALIQKSILDDAEYASMVRCYLKSGTNDR